MRRTMFVANWKALMPSKNQALQFFSEFGSASSSFTKEVVLCPSYVYLDLASAKMPSNVKLGAQDCSQFSNGPYTGEITASVLADLGVKYCIVGHIERRAMGEDDKIFNKKIKQLLAVGIQPIIIIGENLVEYNNNMTRVVIEKQMMECLDGVKEYDKLVFCYQPAWSIGTGHFTSPEYTDIIIDYMRKTLQKISGIPMAGNVPIMYGGGISHSNARQYLECPQVDGIMFAVHSTTVEGLVKYVTMPFTPRGK
ncbi:MAG: triose-phosphate isomerase [Firmicutes bacterium]|nr:triose-phosphate isomerase [Bacillota bacterium]